MLNGPDDAQLSVTARPRHPHQFLVAALKPQGVKRHNVSVVADPMGISVTDDPVRACAGPAPTPAVCRCGIRWRGEGQPLRTR
ncbi:hypothetical protein GCM10023084_58570 [Streptomyces lacrimifluminis]|uniref:Uncharacterized protein n=1 Tax=Streptomyces lacrimifluminis TaxID=1500077 RepID=A0A917P2A8_9ACTN|nr:hypothetical protein [Streptomyces lacrimifluminis]GGJ55736.1 hypothetical protein GCM10012282_61030 [Streptomyces lacrimifluminis]